MTHWLPSVHVVPTGSGPPPASVLPASPPLDVELAVVDALVEVDVLVDVPPVPVPLVDEPPPTDEPPPFEVLLVDEVLEPPPWPSEGKLVTDGLHDAPTMSENQQRGREAEEVARSHDG